MGPLILNIMRKITGLKQNISLKKQTTFKIGGRAKYFIEIKTQNGLIRVLKWAQENHHPFFILGNGSNVLFHDQGYKGIVIKINNFTLKRKSQKTILIGAGFLVGEFLQKCIKNNWAGYEWMAGIPGTIGGAVYGNAGAFGKEMKNFVKTITTLDSQNFKIKHRPLSQCGFDYRTSIFKKNKEIIIAAELKIRQGGKGEIQKTIRENLQYKVQRQMFKYPSAGSVFKNIIIKKTPYAAFYDQANQTVKIKNQIIPTKGGKISAGWFIEQCGLKGKTRQGAKVADFHANVIINDGQDKQAKAEDVLFLINLIKKRVWDKFQINLEEEIIIVSPTGA